MWGIVIWATYFFIVSATSLSSHNSYRDDKSIFRLAAFGAQDKLVLFSFLCNFGDYLGRSVNSKLMTELWM